MALGAEHEPVVTAGIIAAGAFLGVTNTLVTEAVMGAAPVERPIASAAYSFVRFTGGAVGPFVALKLAEKVDLHAPFWFGAAAVAVGVVIVATGVPHHRRGARREPVRARRRRGRERARRRPRLTLATGIDVSRARPPSRRPSGGSRSPGLAA